MNPTLIASSTKQLASRPSFRETKVGPEAELVASFVGQLPFRLQNGLEHVLFREPRVALAAPDLVYVAWRPDILSTWPAARRTLRPAHYRLLQFLRTAEQPDFALPALMRPERRRLLSDLEAAELVSVTADHVDVAPLDAVFAVTRIVAVEAKLTKWDRAIDQAQANTWFASESHILVPRLPRDHSAVGRAQHLGIGVWSLDRRPERLVPPRRFGLPSSYVSWLINDWLIHL